MSETSSSSSENTRQGILVAISDGKGRSALIGGGIAALIGALGSWGLGHSSGGETRMLLEAMVPSTRFLCSAVMTATATILSLMLTMLSFSNNSDRKLEKRFYNQIQLIALVDTIVFVAATMLLLSVSVPLMESDSVPNHWFDTIYYVTLLSTAIIGGALISIVLLLFSAVSGVVSLFHPDEESHLSLEESSSKSDSAQKSTE